MILIQKTVGSLYYPYGYKSIKDNSHNSNILRYKKLIIIDNIFQFNIISFYENAYFNTNVLFLKNNLIDNIFPNYIDFVVHQTGDKRLRKFLYESMRDNINYFNIEFIFEDGDKYLSDCYELIHTNINNRKYTLKILSGNKLRLHKIKNFSYDEY